jgi:hypothetical protein
MRLMPHSSPIHARIANSGASQAASRDIQIAVRKATMVCDTSAASRRDAQRGRNERVGEKDIGRTNGHAPGNGYPLQMTEIADRGREVCHTRDSLNIACCKRSQAVKQQKTCRTAPRLAEASFDRRLVLQAGSLDPAA